MTYFSVGDIVLNTGRGSWRRGTVVCVVPAGASAFLLARKLGYSGSGIRHDSIRDDCGYLIRTEDCDGRVRIRFPSCSCLDIYVEDSDGS